MRLWSFDASTSFDTKTYPRLYTVSCTRYRSFINYAHVAEVWRAFRKRIAGLSSIRHSKSCLEICESPRPVYRCPWRLRFLIRYRMLPFSPTRRRSSLRVLSPRSQPTLGLTSLFADTHQVDGSIKISGCEREITYSYGQYAQYLHKLVK